jgi:hypothetical protein
VLVERAPFGLLSPARRHAPRFPQECRPESRFKQAGQRSILCNDCEQGIGICECRNLSYKSICDIVRRDLRRPVLRCGALRCSLSQSLQVENLSSFTSFSFHLASYLPLPSLQTHVTGSLLACQPFHPLQRACLKFVPRMTAAA